MPDRSAAATQDQDHEFEMVLGNKQLFSVLFFIFVLLGVFFALGYMMGRNSGPVELAAKHPSLEETSSAPLPTRRPQASTPAVVEEAAPRQAAPVEPAVEPSVAAPSPAPVVREETPVSTVVEPKPGQTFLQVSAIAKPEAEILVEVLRKKGFASIVAPGPPGLFRVLVGPSRNDADLAKMRTELEQAGFKPIPRRY